MLRPRLPMMLDEAVANPFAHSAAAGSFGDRHASRVPTSVVLGDLLGDAPTERVTLSWLVARLGNRAFGVVLLLLALLGTLPGISIPASVLLLVTAFQMVMAHRSPIFTRRVAVFPIGTRSMVGIVRRTITVLRYLERFIRPRWQTPFEATRRTIGIAVLLLGLGMLAPIPFSNVPPAILVVLIAFAYLEEDGMLLGAALASALLWLAFVATLVWQTLRFAPWLVGLL